jgi:hypothetical protein
MRSRAVRLTLTLLAVAALGTAGYFTWTVDTREQDRRATASVFDGALTSALRAAFELRAAQQAYVAAGQSESFWFDKVTTLSEALRASIDSLNASAPSQSARDAVARATTSLGTFEGTDRRARNYAATGQKLLASDIIFADGLGAMTDVIESLDQAGAHAASAHAVAAGVARREQVTYVAAAAAVLVFVILLLTPAGTVATTGVAPQERAVSPAPAGTLDLKLRGDEPPVRQPAPVAVQAPKPAPAAPPSTPAPDVEIQALASVCSDLAKLSDTDRLPGILERTARALDASGLVLWVADFEGAELVPVATHGYPASVLARLGTIRRDAENATGAAFRTGLVQTVAATASAGGAIAAPLVTPAGCRGVMSAEVRGGGEKQPARLAAAAIIAAQLAALVGPPPTAASQEREAAL